MCMYVCMCAYDRIIHLYMSLTAAVNLFPFGYGFCFYCRCHGMPLFLCSCVCICNVTLAFVYIYVCIYICRLHCDTYTIYKIVVSACHFAFGTIFGEF